VKHRAHGDFRLPEADIADDQAIHRRILLQIFRDFADGAALIRRQRIRKRVFETFRQGGIRRRVRISHGLQSLQVHDHLIHHQTTDGRLGLLFS